MMRRTTALNFSIIIIAFLCYHQTTIGQTTRSKEVLVNKDICELTISDNESNININILNTTPDTLYLFSSYLHEPYMQSRYLHRLDRDRKEYIVSFVPIPPFIAFGLTDVLIVGENKVVSRFQIRAEFIEIAPSATVSVNINIDKNIFDRNTYVEWAEIRNLSKNDRNYKFNCIDDPNIDDYDTFIELAVYDSKSWYSWDMFYRKEQEYDRCIANYHDLKIPIKKEYICE